MSAYNKKNRTHFLKKKMGKGYDTSNSEKKKIQKVYKHMRR